VSEAAEARGGLAAVSTRTVAFGSLKLAAFLLPFQAFALRTAGTTFEPAYFAALAAVAFAAAPVLFAGRPFPRLPAGDRWVLALFAVAVLSVVVGFLIFGWEEAAAKGVRQLTGMALMVLFFMVTRAYAGDPRQARGIVTALWAGMFCLAAVGVVQFVVANVLGAAAVARWLYTEGPLAGRIFDGGLFGGMYRGVGFAPEPAFYSQFLLLTLGLALVRLRPAARRGGDAPRGSRWGRAGAVFMMGAYFLSLSVVAFVGAAVMALAYAALVSRSGRRFLFRLAVGVVVLVGAYVAVDAITAGGFRHKLDTVALIFQSDQFEITNQTVSSQVLAANLRVAEISLRLNPVTGFGLGGHPVAFSLYAPYWAKASGDLSWISVQDAGALTIRLVSETGLLGLLTFVTAFTVILAGSWRPLRARIKAQRGSELSNAGVGLWASGVALLVVYLCRMGSVYQPSFWMLFGLVAAIPECLAREAAPSRGSHGLS
jgi:hypothetical protein